jgi:polyisoprenoid-binding protein YceI
VTFVAKQMGVPAEGKFSRFKVQLDFDPTKLTASKAQVEVDLASIDTGFAEADTEVKSKGWFHVSAFPTAKFESATVRSLGAGRYEVAGRMTVKGRTREITAPFSVKQQTGVSVFEGTFPLKRLEYGIGEGPWSDIETVADEVQVRFKFIGAPAKQ